LITEHLERKDVGRGRQWCAVHQHAGGLIDDDVIRVLIDDGELHVCGIRAGERTTFNVQVG